MQTRIEGVSDWSPESPDPGLAFPRVSETLRFHSDTRAFCVTRIPARKDNYIFLLHREGAAEAWVVDPADAAPVCAELETQGLVLAGILNTHHHGDHVGGNEALLARFPKAQVICHGADAQRIPGNPKQQVQEGDGFELLGAHVQVLSLPGHTRAHIAYVIADEGTPGSLHVFLGDVLFGGGCGYLFEGTHEQMLDSLRKVRALPSDTLVWTAHEYTAENYGVDVLLEPENRALRNYFEEIMARRRRGEATVPLRLGDERRVNPFLRWDDPLLRKNLGSTSDLDTFRATREFRNRF